MHSWAWGRNLELQPYWAKTLGQTPGMVSILSIQVRPPGKGFHKWQEQGASDPASWTQSSGYAEVGFNTCVDGTHQASSALEGSGLCT